MSPRAFGYVMGTGFIAWLVCTMVVITTPPEQANLFWLSTLITVVPLIAAKIGSIVFRNH